MTTPLIRLNPKDHPVGSRVLVTTIPYAMYSTLPGDIAQEAYVEEWATEGHVKLRLPLHNNLIFWLLAPKVENSHVLSILKKEEFANKKSQLSLYADSGTIRIVVRKDEETGALSKYLQHRATINTLSTTGIVGMPVTKYSEWEDVPVVDATNL